MAELIRRTRSPGVVDPEEPFGVLLGGDDDGAREERFGDVESVIGN